MKHITLSTVFLSVLLITGCNQNTSVPGLGNTTEDFEAEYGENEINQDESNYDYTDNTGYLSVSFEVERATEIHLDLQALERDEFFSEEDAIEQVRSHLPYDVTEENRSNEGDYTELTYTSEQLLEFVPEFESDNGEAVITVELMGSEEGYTEAFLMIEGDSSN
ncbi:hypothetical protein MM326_04370 [Alkalihalobacillus sp. LMS6]|uniref:hypothetical protein n=1 Tax=Alkalihalobacillus sp. LMS6 TaxID=2924034 RepID=UPI0020D054D4|nr:hypothetical protein [Alkalihalobacillus sp. LMS6]UTR07275.1 hypothetical protein MM326_04370 [Alkalihalobacillus sp. LMS6]